MYYGVWIDAQRRPEVIPGYEEVIQERRWSASQVAQRRPEVIPGYESTAYAFGVPAS